MSLQTRRLVVTHRGATEKIELPKKGSLVIGRAKGCDVRLEDKSVSRRHAAFHVGGELTVEDLGSHNGTVLILGPSETNGDSATGLRHELKLKPNTRRALPDDAIIQIGTAVVTVEVARARRQATQHGEGMIVLEPAMERLYELAERVAPSDLSVLVLGESGVGKDVLSRFLHERSLRSEAELVTLNCGALPEHLLESELFGYEKGAFTGAAKSTPGLLEVASGGSLFFDEVGELTPSLQVKLLRVLEGKQVMRVGGRQPISVDVRFIAATNRDVEREVAAGRFREDLFYRLNGISLTIPPLRERKRELLAFAELFLAEHARDHGGGTLQLSDGARTRLLGYHWPGNVRQLKNVIKRAAVLAQTQTIEAEHIHLPAKRNAPTDEPSGSVEFAIDESPSTVTQAPAVSPTSLREQAEDLERQSIIDALEACAGNQTRAAEMLGISRRALVGRLNKYNIPRPRRDRKK